MSNNYKTKAESIIQNILSHANSNLDNIKIAADLKPYLPNFIKAFYQAISHEEIVDLPTDALCTRAATTLSFTANRKNNETKIRIYQPEMESHGWTRKGSVVEVLHENMPFIVDSVTEALAGSGLNIDYILHPVLSVERDKDGNISSLEDQPENGSNESLLHIAITGTCNEQQIKNIEREVLKTLSIVRLAVADWKDMVGKIDYVVKEMDSYSADIKNSINADFSEVKDFLAWLQDDNYTFVGYVNYSFVDDKGNDQLRIIDNSELGIFKADEEQFSRNGLSALPAEALHFLKEKKLLEITKSNQQSLVHRPTPMDYIGIKYFDSKGNVIGEHRFLGLFTSVVYYQSANLIPIIRDKINHVLERSGFVNNGHAQKELMSALESLPRDELFQMTRAELFETSMSIVSLAVKRNVKLFVRQDKFERFMSCLVYIPRESLSTPIRTKLENTLEEKLGGKATKRYTQVSDSPLARLNIIIKTEPGSIPDYNIEEIEEILAEIACVWEDVLLEHAIRLNDYSTAKNLHSTYSKAFSAAYKDMFSPRHAVWDIKRIELVRENGGIYFDLYETSEDEGVSQLKIYSPNKQIILSDIMPILENMGLNILNEHTYKVNPSETDDKVWIYHFRLDASDHKECPDLEDIRSDFETTLYKVWHKETQNDSFNQLVFVAGLKWREVVLLRSYSKYLKQIGFKLSNEFVAEALVNNQSLSKLIVKLFFTKFDTDFKGNREQAIDAIKDEINEELVAVSDINEDRAIRTYVDLVNATLRTNFFQPDENGYYKKYISYKFNSANVPDLPSPVPYAEIFVYSTRVEAIHLRGGKVARGGLRWSDRGEDFRTEVLGLMKAQTPKNSVIVPVGSKGGFVVQQPPAGNDRQAFINEGIECYKTFLRGMLDITDNLVDGNVIPPKAVVRHDGDDPYLVVAADKGTATFSDIANGIAKDYGFWLSDAFASGGSVGYDHKEMGITAKGAWVSVQRHFFEKGVDVQNEDFTVAGVGDMSGDVFGNGMLLSEHIKLVAAFNHLHIFIDPNPNATASFKERKRLFELPRSSWTDYDAKLISKGGMIFDRSEKSLNLSKEIQEALDFHQDKATPDELISAILKSPVDLLWNGGIGTYVKSSSESNEIVGDRSNDSLRVNGKELRCKVIGEGGNLGFTQRGRIEYSLNGGAVNTDFIDNSAGVDCSDHEVNIKIAFEQAIENGNLKAENRDALLASMTDEVAELVLVDNYVQAQSLTSTQSMGVSLIDHQQRLIHNLELSGLLKRDIEFLPNDEEIAVRKASGKGLTRPELAVLLSYSKIDMYDNLLNSGLPDEEYLTKDLFAYFPKDMQDKFPDEIMNHQLKRNIIANEVTNSFVNRMGSRCFKSVMENTGLKGCDIARSYILVRDLFDLDVLWGKIKVLQQSPETNKGTRKLTLEIQRFVSHQMMWLLRTQPQPLDMTGIVNLYKSGIAEISECILDVMSDSEMAVYNERVESYKQDKIPDDVASQVALFSSLSFAYDIIKLTHKNNIQIADAGKIYFALKQNLGINWLRNAIDNLVSDGYWNKLSIQALSEDLNIQLTRLALDVISNYHNNDKCDGAVNQWLEDNNKQIDRFRSFIDDLKSLDNIDFSMLMVAIKRVESIKVE